MSARSCHGFTSLSRRGRAMDERDEEALEYRALLEEVGAKVNAFKAFGSFQGDWFAHVLYNDRAGWVHGQFGSCPTTDDLQEIDDRRRGAARSVARWRYGRQLLDSLLTQAEAERLAAKNIEWDHDAEEMLMFVAQRREHWT